MNILKGDAGGIYFRDKSTISPFSTTYYNFLIYTNGSYELSIFTLPFRGATPSTSLNDGFNLAMKGENHPFLIAAVANGNQIDIYVNHQSVASVTDRTIDQGGIGVLAVE